MFPETRQKSLEEIDILFEENIPAWKTRSGSRMDERALSYQRGDSGVPGKRNSDVTLQQDENAEKLPEPKNLEHNENPIKAREEDENVEKAHEQNIDRAASSV